MRKCQPDAVIHLAAINLGIGIRTKYPATILRDNTMMTFNILESARDFKIKKVIMTLSTGMYPDDTPMPVKEDYIHDGRPHQSNYGYLFAKRLMEPAIRAYRTEYSLNVIGLVPNWLFGEYDNFNYEDAGVLPALIRRFYENKDGESKITIWGDGSPLREYTYSSDIAKAYIWSLHNYDDEQILNIGTTEEHSVREIALMIADILGIDKGKIEFDTSKASGSLRKSTDNSRFVKISNFQYTPFRIGLEKTINWYSKTASLSPDSIRIGRKTKLS